MRAGETFLLLGSDDHLWAIISDPAMDPQHVVIVLFVSWAEKYDQACILHKGQHPFIKHDTCVRFLGARVETDAKLEQLLRSGKLRRKDPLSADVLGLIRQKAECSDMPLGAYEVLRQQGFVP